MNEIVITEEDRELFKDLLYKFNIKHEKTVGEIEEHLKKLVKLKNEFPKKIIERDFITFFNISGFIDGYSLDETIDRFNEKLISYKKIYSNKYKELFVDFTEEGNVCLYTNREENNQEYSNRLNNILRRREDDYQLYLKLKEQFEK